MQMQVPWLSWLKRLPSKQEITSSNLVGTLSIFLNLFILVINLINTFRWIFLIS